jgi:hypothetical protein
MLKFALMLSSDLVYIFDFTSPLVPCNLKYLLSGPFLQTVTDLWPRVKKIVNKRAAEFEAENHT